MYSLQDLITSKIGLSSSIFRALNESFSISSKFAHMWDWNEAGLSPHSLNMQEKNCMAILIRGGEVVEREDVRPRRMSRCIYVVYKCVHIEVGMQIELSQTQQHNE